MTTFKCKMCGGTLEIQEGQTVAECEYCGAKQTVAKSRDEVISNLFSRANSLRMKSEFDRAEQTYEKILEQDNTEAEAHWGIVLCRYGIEYVEDPKTFKRIPTCHRTSYKAVTADADYLAALEYADISQKAIYQAEAKAIDEIQKNILTIVKNEKPFDVFICYKETDESGKRTIDSTIANDIYYQLTQEGFKVFYAAITLEDKLGQAYEPYIFAALNSAKVMLVLGTKPEYFNAVWVKNEWSRFLQLMRNDRSKLLIPCYRNMDAYNLPEEFAHLQAQDMGKIGFINDVVRGIKKVVKTETAAPTVVKEVIKETTGNTGTTALIKRAFLFLEDGDWASANEYCEKVLDIDPENSEAYLGKLMAELHVRKQVELKNLPEIFDENSNYQKAVRYGSEKAKAELQGYIAFINTRNENARLEKAYTQAKKAMSLAKNVYEYQEASRQFQKLSNYQDAADLAKKCLKLAESAKKDDIYDEAKEKMKRATVTGYSAAIPLFKKIPGWRDADELIVTCNQKIDELKAKAERTRQERARIAKRNKKIALIVTPIVCAVIAFIVLLNTVIIPNGKYNDALALMEAGKYEEAISAFKEMDGYKDSAAKITECEAAIFDALYNEVTQLLSQGNLQDALDLCDTIQNTSTSNTLRYSVGTYLLENEQYEAAEYVFSDIDSYKDAKAKARYARATRAQQLEKQGEYETAYNLIKEYAYFADCTQAYQSICYSYATNLFSEGQYGSAANIFNKILDYSDAKSMYNQCAELGAQHEFDQGNYTTVIEMLEGSDSFDATNDLYIQACLAEAKRRISNNELSAPVYIEKIPQSSQTLSLLKDVKYTYILANQDNSNTYTHIYLKELKAASYKDCDQIWDELYAWKVTLKNFNTTSDDYYSNLSYLPTSSSYLHMFFYLTGGEPGETVTIYHKEQWPGGLESKSDWNWENYSNGDVPGIQWSNGVTASAGTYIIKFYNAADDSCIGSVSIPVGKPIDQSDYVTSGRVTISNSGYYVTDTSNLHTNSAGVQKYELKLSSNKSDALVFNIKHNSDGTYSFLTDDGRYLLADGTNVKLVATATADTKFVFESGDNGLMIRCATATYEGNAQYLESYMGYLTCYSLQSNSNTSNFLFLTERA